MRRMIRVLQYTLRPVFTVSAILAATLTLPWPAGAQNRFETIHRDVIRRLEVPRAAGAGRFLRAPQPTPAQTAIDVLHYDVDIACDHLTLLVEGRVTALIEAVQGGVTAIEFNADPVLVILAAELAGSGSAPFARSGDVVAVTLPAPLGAGERTELTLLYRGAPTTAAGTGFFIRYDGATPVIYTLSQPWSARTWWPCKDYPDDKATFDIALSVKEPLTAASNGVLLAVDDTTRWSQPFKRHRWRESYPMSPYLFSIAATEYVQLTDEFVYAVAGTMQVVNYVYPRLAAAAAIDLDIQVPALRFFSQTFGLYPFIGEKYGVALCRIGGGMEHQTLCSYGDFLIRGDHYYDWLYIHELAHQWFGDLITCRDWTHIWLNEGWASYSEALWFEHVDGPQALHDYMETHDEPHRWSGPILRDPDSDDPWYYFDPVVYSKAAWVLHMLRHIMGDAPFFEATRGYVAAPQFRFGAVDTEEFIAFFEGYYGGDLHWFFDPWLSREDRLVYEWDWNRWVENGEERLSIMVRQAVELPYAMPVDLEIVTAAGTIREKLWVDDIEESFVLSPGATVQDAALDPDRWILCDVARASAGGGGETPEAAFLLQNYPNPFNPSTTISFGLDAPCRATLRVYDARGALVATLVDGTLGEGIHRTRWDGTDESGDPVASGVYFCRLSAGGNLFARKMLLLR
ncbi:MAG: M1 family aminopeptidase [Candidatus Krumholzibacteria bacterium]|nr:M1 family aminopeptidase [Candidatus Krumholzibacteria bacterium]